ncbi:hypothetical protein ACWF94_39995 [Streptomyces sp. NPDC055078]
MERRTRTTLAAVTTAALLAGSVGVGLAVADAGPVPKPERPTVATKKDDRRERPALTARATRNGVYAWQQFRVYGNAKDLRPGTRVALQQRHGKRWVTLPASMNTTRQATYKMRVYLGLKGRNTLRIVGGGKASQPFTVYVR